jgi:hypothetical protein
MLPLLSPPPRFYDVQHPEGDVLVIATDRSLSLVPDTVGGRWVYHLRIHDQTCAAPEYLVSDLMLGRRQRPVLRISEMNIRLAQDTWYYNDRWHATGIRIEPSVLLENDSLTWAEDVRVGIMGWSTPASEETDFSRNLRSHISIHKPAHPPVFGIVHARSTEHVNPDGIEPLLSVRFACGVYTIPYRIDNELYAYVWLAAMYVMARNAPPAWFQIELTVDHALLELARDQCVLPAVKGFFRLTRLSGVQPTVAIVDVETSGQSLKWDSALGRAAQAH